MAELRFKDYLKSKIHLSDNALLSFLVVRKNRWKN